MAGEVKFIVELTDRDAWDPRLALAADVAADNLGVAISVIATGPAPEASYWLDWGGTYDNPRLPKTQIFFEAYLQEVSSVPLLLSTEGSFLVIGAQVYIHTARSPWQYKRELTEWSVTTGFCSQVADPLKPSDTRFAGDGFTVRYPQLLKIPGSSLRTSLPDPIFGTALYRTFKVTLNNEDGRFDRTENANYFNTPIVLKKTRADRPTLADYVTIRSGLVDTIEADMDQIVITGADSIRTLDEEVCDEFTSDAFPNAADSVIGKPMPAAWGPITGAKLTKVGTNQYVACDPAYLTSVSAVYDSDGQSVAFSVLNGIVSASDADSPDSCDFVGDTNNSIGQIITAVLQARSGIAYQEGNWDLIETDPYVATSARIGLIFSGQRVKDLVQDCLENDSAFLIQKNDGRLTIRQWGVAYAPHVLSSWQFTKKPKKTYLEQRYYASSIEINFGYREDDGTYTGTVINDADEASIIEEWRKQQRLKFDTRLLQQVDAAAFSEALFARLSCRPEIWTIVTGEDASNINVLDAVTLTIDVNGRRMSANTSWIVREVNPAQDELVLESQGV